MMSLIEQLKGGAVFRKRGREKSISSISKKRHMTNENEFIRFLGKYADPSFKDEDGNNAVLYACIHGRIDVLHWLIDENDFTLDTRDHDDDGPIELAIWKGHTELLHALVRAKEDGGFGLSFNTETNDPDNHPIMRTIFHRNTELLHELVKPSSQGGFGLSLDVRDKVNFEPVMHAVQKIAFGEIDSMDLFKAYIELIKPVEQGGFGLKINKSIHRNFPYDSPRADLTSEPYVMVLCSYMDEKDKVAYNVLALNTNTWHASIFQSDKMIGSGAYGSVEKFTDSGSGKSLAVKRPVTPRWKKLRSRNDYVSELKAVKREYKYLTKAFPEYGPYSFQEMRDYSRGEVYYSYALIMQYFDGEDLDYAYKHAANIQNKLTCNCLYVANMFLECAKELHKLHGKGITHGDIRPANFRIKSDGLYRCTARLIDFYFSKKIGKETICTIPQMYYAPEIRHKIANAHPSQDVYSLAVVFNELLKETKFGGVRAIDKVYKLFPSIKYFIDSGREVNPSARPDLSDFIAKLENDISAYVASKPKLSQNCLFNPADKRQKTEHEYNPRCRSHI